MCLFFIRLPSSKDMLESEEHGLTIFRIRQVLVLHLPDTLTLKEMSKPGDSFIA